MRSRSVVLSLLALAAASWSGMQVAEAFSRRGPPALIGPPPPLDAAGCYFYRGRQWCGRYCYYEVNGKRYCQRWERDAHPQAPVELLPPPPSAGLK